MLRNILRSGWDLRFSQYLKVYREGSSLFKVADFGPTCRMRAKTFELKEPETLDWIDGMSDADVLIDIGSNIGLYSVYAGLRGITTYAVEPDALNFALLNLNINKNGLGERVVAFCVALHDHTCISTLAKQYLEWGGALSCFEGNTDQHGNSFKSIHQQGAFGLSLDNFCKLGKINPTHIKLDVDGNELLVLSGARECLSNTSLRSVLIELDETNPDHDSCVDMLEKSGLKMQMKCQSELVARGGYNTSFNCIYRRED